MSEGENNDFSVNELHVIFGSGPVGSAVLVAQGKKVCIVVASGKLGKYMIQHALDRDYGVVGVCRERSVGKLDAFKGRITFKMIEKKI